MSARKRRAKQKEEVFAPEEVYLEHLED